MRNGIQPVAMDDQVIGLDIAIKFGVPGLIHFNAGLAEPAQHIGTTVQEFENFKSRMAERDPAPIIFELQYSNRLFIQQTARPGDDVEIISFRIDLDEIDIVIALLGADFVQGGYFHLYRPLLRRGS